MIKKFMRYLRRFWWAGMAEAASWWGTEVYAFEKKRRQRNDEEETAKARKENPLFLEQYGYKVFSQNDEDGIIAEIFNRIGVTNKIFVEFGVQDGLECNTHFLLHQGWNGLWLEGSAKYCSDIKKLFAEPVKNGRLKIVNAFIDKDNIDSLIKNNLPAEVCSRGGGGGNRPFERRYRRQRLLCMAGGCLRKAAGGCNRIQREVPSLV